MSCQLYTLNRQRTRTHKQFRLAHRCTLKDIMGFFTFHFASLIFVNHNETETGGEETREKKRRYMQRLWAATQLCLCVFICVCLCVRVVIALELLWPHVNYISNRGLLLCWARAQEDKHTRTQTQTHIHTLRHTMSRGGRE